MLQPPSQIHCHGWLLSLSQNFLMRALKKYEKTKFIGGRGRMHLACAVVQLLIPEVYSLKDRRRIVKSLTATIGRAFNVAAADLNPDEAMNLAVIGLTAVSNEYSHAVALRESVIRALEKDDRFEVHQITTDEIKLDPAVSYS
jgi:hypothetical protein